MNICVLSAGPVFPKHVHGGSQKILREILFGLSKSASVKVLCVNRPDLSRHNLNSRIEVLPILTYRTTYPNPYDTHALKIVNIAAQVNEYTRDANVVYNHDGQMIFRESLNDVPSIFSCRDLWYPDTIVGLIVNHKDTLIVNSKYSEQCALSLLKRQGISSSVRIVTICNGIDLNFFRPRHRIQRSVFFKGKVPDDAFLALSPGRPDIGKGHKEALLVVSELNRLLAPKKVFIGIPRYIDESVDVSLEEYYGNIEHQANSLGIRDRLVYHDWFPYEQMPKLYSAANLVLGLGNFPECFGNTYVEAMCCGTPSIIAEVGANRTIPPDGCVLRVPYGDLNAAVVAAERCLVNRWILDIKEARRIAAKEYGFKKMVESYSMAILGTARGELVGRIHQIEIPSFDSSISLTPWVSLQNNKLFHDYEGDYINDEDVCSLARFISNNCHSRWDCIAAGISVETLERAYRLAVIE